MNFRKLCRIACVFLLIFFSLGDALAATIHGTVYEWNSFKPLNNTIIEVNSTPRQEYVATDANYSFNLTPGSYRITANYFEGTNLIYTIQEIVVISGEGEYVHDLLLFPPYQEELLSQNGSEVPDLNFDTAQAAFQRPTSWTCSTSVNRFDTKQPVSQTNFENFYLVSAFLAFVAVTLMGVYLLTFFIKNKNKNPPEIIDVSSGNDIFSGRNGDLKRLEAGTQTKEAEAETQIKEAEFSEETEEISPDSLAENPDDDFEIQSKIPASANVETKEPQEDRKTNLPDDLKELLNMIRASGNRITQRELRKKSPYSESKVSLMLSDLEERGLIEKFKRGRGNIIRIPDEHISRQTEDESKQE